jgi:hypothetical protein
MARRRDPKPFVTPSSDPASRAGQRRGNTPARSARQQVIPDAVASRMVRRIAIATGVPTVLGILVVVLSYLLVSRGLFDIPPGLTLLGSGAFFLLGLLGLSYGVLSAGWEDQPGSLLGLEQIGVNIGRMRASVKAMRQGREGSGGTHG